MEIEKKNQSQKRIRMQVTLSSEASIKLRLLSAKTYVPMSKLLDQMILEYIDKHQKDFEE